MLQKQRNYIKKHQLLKAGDVVVAGVSGGADSMCMLHQLVTVSREFGISVCVVHIEHGIRGQSSKEDAAFVKQACKDFSLPFHLVERDVPAEAKRRGLSLEEAARKARYEVFYQILKKCNGTKIAVAHHQNDQAETVLFHLFRGSGIRGAGGIRPVNGRVIRPLLCLDRSEIMQYLKTHQIAYRTDETNQEDCYTRNRIRHRILPEAGLICQGAVGHLAKTAEVFQEAEDYLSREGRRLSRELGRRDGAGQGLLLQDALLEEEPILQKYALLEGIREVGGQLQDISAVHLETALKLYQRPVGKTAHLPSGLLLQRDYEGLKILQRKAAAEKDKGSGMPEQILVTVPGEYSLGEGRRILFTLEERKKNLDIPEKLYTKWFDYDKMKFDLFLRKRRAGDYLTVNANMERQKLKSYFINTKIPREERDKIWLLAVKSHVVWAAGYRISEYYKVTGQTSRIVKVQIVGGDTNE